VISGQFGARKPSSIHASPRSTCISGYGAGKIHRCAERTAVAIIPTAEFGKTSLDVARLGSTVAPLCRNREIPERVTIDREQAVFVKSSLKVQILDPCVRLIAWQPVLFLELAPDHRW